MSHKLIIYLTLVITALMMIGCNRTITKRTIKGIVYDSIYGMPIKNVTVSYVQYNSYLSSTVTEEVTDETGQFEFRERKFYGKTGNLEIHARIEPDYFGVENRYDFGMEVIDPSDVKMFSDNKIEFKSQPFGFLKVIAINNQPSDQEKLYFNYSFDNLQNPLLDNNLSYFFLLPCNEIRSFKWNVLKSDGSHDTYEDSIYVPAWDTVEYVINY